MESKSLNYSPFIKALSSMKPDSPPTNKSRISQLNVPDSQSNWMSLLPPSAFFNQLLLVASHCSNSCKFTTNLYDKTYNRTQSLDVEDQLKMGVRKLDLRVGSVGLKKENKIKLRYEGIVDACAGKVKDDVMREYMKVSFGVWPG